MMFFIVVVFGLDCCFTSRQKQLRFHTISTFPINQKVVFLCGNVAKNRF